MIILATFAALLGAAVGSFLNVCIWRLPRQGLGLSEPPRSFCPSCGTAIRWQDNIPVWSWLWLGGQCRACRAPISPRYLAVELLTAGLFVAIAWRYLDPAASAPLAFLVAATLVAATLVGAFIDIELRIIPNEITLRGMMLAPGAVLCAPEILRVQPGSAVPRFLTDLAPRVEALAAHLPSSIRTGVWPGAIALAAALAVAYAGVRAHAAHRRWREPAEAHALCESALAGVLFAWGCGAAAFHGVWPWAIALAAALAAAHVGVRAHAAYRRWREPAEAHPLSESALAGVLFAWGCGAAAFHLVLPASLAWPRAHAFWVGALGMATGAALIQAVGFIGTKVFRKPAMGFGDVKLMGLLGAFTGPLACVEAFFLACFLGSAIGGYYWFRYRDRYIPFGPFLTAGALLMILWPEAFESLLDWYLGFFRIA